MVFEGKKREKLGGTAGGLDTQGKKALAEEIWFARECERASEATVTVEAGALDFPEMEGHGYDRFGDGETETEREDRKSTRLNSSH